jgi:hypothetical protein
MALILAVALGQKARPRALLAVRDSGADCNIVTGDHADDAIVDEDAVSVENVESAHGDPHAVRRSDGRNVGAGDAAGRQRRAGRAATRCAAFDGSGRRGAE